LEYQIALLRKLVQEYEQQQKEINAVLGQRANEEAK
jgi:hypothetical protein